MQIRKAAAQDTERSPNETEYAGLVQLVERLLAKEKVEGPSPLARSKKCAADLKW